MILQGFFGSVKNVGVEDTPRISEPLSFFGSVKNVGVVVTLIYFGSVKNVGVVVTLIYFRALFFLKNDWF